MERQFEEMLEDCEVGFAVLPDGEEILVKGKAVLGKTVEQNVSRLTKVARVGVHDRDEADELWQRYDGATWSFEGRDYVMVPQTSLRTMFYISTIRSGSARGADKGYVYRGVVLRIPKKDVGTAHQYQHDTPPDDILAAIESARDGRFTVVRDEPMERFEIFDMANGDMLVMYRVACIERTPNC